MKLLRGHRYLTVVSVLWCLGIVAPSLLHASGIFPIGEFLVRYMYSPVCHQDHLRSFALFGVPLSVCARCSATYAAFTLIVLLYPLFGRFLRSQISVRTLLLFLAPMAVDVALSLGSSWQSTIASRTLTGITAGIGLGLFVVPSWEEAWEQIIVHRTYTRPTVKELRS